MYNKILLSLALAMTTPFAGTFVAAQTTSSEQAPYVYDIADGEADIYGYLRFDTRLRDYGVMHFASNAPDSYTMTKSYGMIAGESSVFTAGTMVGDKMVAYRVTYYANVFMPEGICLVDPKTGEYEMKWKYEDDGSHLIIDEMTYDPKTDRIFAMHYDTNMKTTDLYEVDTKTYALKPLGTIKGTALMTLAADNGWLYGVSYSLYGNSFLMKIDEATASQPTAVKVGDENLDMVVGNYSQSMEFDKTTHRLWWVAQAVDDNSYLVELDAKTGKIISQKLIKGNPQILGMAIPYQYVADNAPSYVGSFAAAPTSEGANEVRLTWTNPSKDYRGGTLSAITSLKVYRNSSLVTTISDAKPGEAATWTDKNVPSGAYIYKVVPANASGDGIYRESRTFVGYDVPAAPQNVTLKASGKNATITWTAPTEGLNGGTFDKASLSYDVVRMPDNKTVATSLKQCSVTDEALEHAGYSYIVTAKNAQGKGGSAQSNVVAFGPSYGIPFVSPLNTKDDFGVWTPVDNNNDGHTWAFEQYENVAFYDRSETEDADDWLFSPSLLFDGNKEYQLRYTYYSTNWVTESMEEVKEKMDVRYGTEQTPSAMTTVLKDLGEFHTASGYYLYGKDVFKPQNGEGYIAFHAMSEHKHGRIFLKDVSVREYSDKDLSVTDFTGSATVNCGVSQTFTVSVRNEGKATVSAYKAQIINAETGEVLAEAAGKPVGKDEAMDVPVEWTPAAEGEVKVTARVVLDGDTYPADNTAQTTLTVKIAPAHADRWITVNKDETEGWLGAFYMNDKHWESQSLFLEKEMQKKDIDITGLQFTFNGKTDGAYTFPAKIFMKQSQLDNLLRKEGSILGVFELNGWTKVFDGELTIQGAGDNKEFYVKFDKPYHYAGGNVNVRVNIDIEDDVMPSADHPVWHLSYTTGKNRYAYYRGSKEDAPQDEIFTQDYMPYMLFSYIDNTSGIGSLLTNDDVQISFDGLQIVFSQPVDRAEVFTINGAAVVSVSATSAIGTSVLPNGTYIVKASKGQNTVVKKIVK